MKRRNLLLLPLAAAIAASNPAENQPAAPGSLTHQAAVDQLYANHWRANGYRILGPVDYSQPLAWHREALCQALQQVRAGNFQGARLSPKPLTKNAPLRDALFFLKTQN
jgi:hypothetical protein